ncbi:class F sortase [Rhodococcus sp. X156]|uniref:class F sortase n=1 Tax=Rhodococcus sp. X156 TaxID=2499145 RepID=UPI000FDB4293|nr:class F sortase [Rhodococcus sp. X156]
MSERTTTARVAQGGLVVAILVALVAGVVLIVQGSRSEEPAAAPLPSVQFNVPAAELPPLEAAPAAADPLRDKPAGCELAVAPSTVVIGSLCLSGRLVPASTTETGALNVPRDVHVVGMWDQGAPLAGPAGEPVAEGTTLLAGHVNDYSQGNGVLYDLYKVQPGAVVHAADAAGHTTRWRVTAQEVVVKAALPKSVFAGPVGERKLVLVTCGGPIVHVPGYGNTYRDNVVVTAVPA